MGLFDFFLNRNVDKRLPEEIELESLLERAATGEDVADAFYESLMASIIYVLVPDGFDWDNEPLNVLLFDEENIPFFSSVPRIMDNRILKRRGANYIRIDAASFLGSIVDKPVILNPFSRFGKQFTVDELKDLLENYCEEEEG